MSATRPTKQRWGIITVVLLVDLGLAAAGVVMLREGLRDTVVTPVAPSPANAKADSPPAAPSKPTPADPGPPNVEPIAKAGDTKTADAKADKAEPAPAPVAGGATTPPTPPPTTPGARSAQHRSDATKATRKKDAKGGPLDPYGDAEPPVDVGSQVDQIMAKSRATVDTCYAEAAKAVPPDQVPHGVVKIAFRVLPDGHIEHAAAVENTTSSEPLAACLVREVNGWSVPAHAGDAVDFVRAFSF